jgi:phospholipid N-methyltransferase
MMADTREPQYQPMIDLRKRQGLTPLGLMSNLVWHEDPKRLGIVLARYKFVAKMLAGSQDVLEVGCADAFCTRVVLQEVERLTAVDFDPLFIEDARRRRDPEWPFECRVHDILEGPVIGPFDGVFALDLLEHIPREQEQRFLSNLAQSLAAHGVLILGSPSLQSQAYASPASREGHVNCKDAPGLKSLIGRYFHNVFIFSMNDEVVHTGFYPMAHYLFAVCCGPKLHATP